MKHTGREAGPAAGEPSLTRATVQRREPQSRSRASASPLTTVSLCCHLPRPVTAPLSRPGKVENQTVLPFVWIHRNADTRQHPHPQRNSYTHMDWHRGQRMKEGMSNNSTTSISQARKAVEQLKMEACMDRVKNFLGVMTVLLACEFF
ncbi:guanine nucleotide-binding protein G(I)/G(S)/G(O) subunit gamma-4 isoform X2 [Felis catus]|uniref:guanine nucleotide-binding protein G(I)/G(S)/G(O) subunit gamma-4 isoform X2 n=1 Tax=Felis catus TaxID=9685 RepID=UPI001D19FF61|nr:guanine nucleotide-binding protein G(I)/G(S)/G(O) subunit gamma-4 isoform X2 [Felis catus]